MLGRSALLLFFVAVAVSASVLPAAIGPIPEQFKGNNETRWFWNTIPLSEFLPEEATQFYADLTAEDKEILKEVALKHEEYKTEDDALNALKAKSEKLYNKAIALRNLVKEKIDALEPEPKAFVENVRYRFYYREVNKNFRALPSSRPSVQLLEPSPTSLNSERLLKKSSTATRVSLTLPRKTSRPLSPRSLPSSKVRI